MKKFAVLTILVVVLIALVIPSSVFADTPVPIGGLGLREYCHAHGYADVTLTKDHFGPNAAFNNWRCVEASGALHPFSMEQACRVAIWDQRNPDPSHRPK